MDPLIEDNISSLNQAVGLLEQMDVDAATEIFSRVGAHIRHNIDHYLSFFKGLPLNAIDYDSRDRDPRIEAEIGYAKDKLEEVIFSLNNINPNTLSQNLRVKMDCGTVIENAGAWTDSSVRRELQFLHSHTVHHHALIMLLCQGAGVPLPADFGVASSTIKFRARQACAP